MDEESSSKRSHEGEHVGETKRHASEAERSGMNLVRTTRPNEKPQSYRGGNRVQLSANFFRLPKLPDWSIYKYHATFEPECLLARLRNAMIAQHKDQIGGFVFDGVQLFATHELPNETTVFESCARDETVYKISCKFTKIVSPNSRDYIQVLNLILRRANAALNLKLVNRSYYDADAMIDLSQFRLQLWPGYQTMIQNYRNDILVNCDVIHKAMRTDTVYSIMTEIHAKDRNNFQNNFKQQILGKMVLTDYNNQTYRIDDIDFNINPETTFKKGDQDISIRDYYAEKYQKEILDLKQPILISKLKDRSLRGGTKTGPIWLVPEFCRMTGLSDRQRNDINLKNAMKPYSQMIPKIRRQRILDFNNRIQTKPTSVGVITEWNLGLDREMVRIDGYRIGPEFLRFADQERQVSNAGWNRECGPNMKVYQTASLKRWYAVYPRQMEKEITKFIRRVMEIGKKMNFHISTPKAVIVSHDRELATKVNELVNSGNPQMLFFGLVSNKNSNADTYAAIKKRCFTENAIASQVATNYILSREKGYDSIITKIAIQMCTKLGGAPWTIRIPVGGVMTIGFDVSKDTQNKSLSFGCMVATMDLKESANFFAHVTSYSNTETLAKEFGIGVREAINAWLAKYQSLPRKIVIYRGGISDGELSYLVDVEVKLIESRLKEIYESQGADMRLAFIVVTKKVNARIFAGESNPEPGTVVDDVITLSERNEFYLVSQSCTQGTVSPTNYNIIYDNFDDNWQIDRFAIWSYKQTHLYYNWTGTTRVPAPLQYATKLCFMVSNYLHQRPDSGLENNLYFL